MKNMCNLGRVIEATGEITTKLDRSASILNLYLPILKSVQYDTCSIVRRVMDDGI